MNRIILYSVVIIDLCSEKTSNLETKKLGSLHDVLKLREQIMNEGGRVIEIGLPPDLR